MRIIALILSVILLTACTVRLTPAATDEQSPSPVSYRIAPRRPDPRQKVSAVTATDTEVHYSKDHLTLVLRKPHQWETLATDYGIVISEHFASVETAGVLEGLLAYASVIPLPEEITSPDGLVQSMLNDSLSRASDDQGLTYTDVTSFKWDGYDAAYYLASDDEGNAMFVVGVAVPEQGVMVTCTVSAPYDQHTRIPEILPTLLDAVRVNTVQLSYQPFVDLVKEMKFPPPPTVTSAF